MNKFSLLHSFGCSIGIHTKMDIGAMNVRIGIFESAESTGDSLYVDYVVNGYTLDVYGCACGKHRKYTVKEVWPLLANDNIHIHQPFASFDQSIERLVTLFENEENEPFKTTLNGAIQADLVAYQFVPLSEFQDYTFSYDPDSNSPYAHLDSALLTHDHIVELIGQWHEWPGIKFTYNGIY